MLLRPLTLLILTLAVGVGQGCSGPVREPAVPDSLTGKAEIPGLPGVRYRLSDLDAMTAEAAESVRRELAYRASKGEKGPLPPANFLAVSGGGDDGAFGAGLLSGWTAAGNRPEFKLVTGISTGALIAPFAFLGPAYDAALKSFYTDTKPSDIAEPRPFVAILTSDSMADNTPLWNRVSKAIDRPFLDAVAAEYAKGRLLLVATTDLDARQAVIWNMTRIAANPDPRALDLFRSIMIASAAIPGAFPPVMIDVVANGKHYQEMHVDGGAMSQVFVYPPSLKVGAQAKASGIKELAGRKRNVYIIRNGRLDMNWADVDRRLMSIAGRAISSLINTQGVGDLYRIYATSQRDGVAFNLAYIPASFNAPHPQDFDTAYMRQLFDLAYGLAAKGYPWEHQPPGLGGPVTAATATRP